MTTAHIAETTWSSLENSAFLTEIIRDANEGRSFVPFIGSGLSSPSGIIMGMEFTNYLAFATYLVLSDPRSRAKTHGEGRTAIWDLRYQGWPPLPSETEVNDTREWVKERFIRICTRLGLELNYDDAYDRGVSRIKSLSTPPNQSALNELVSSLSQPPIPLILRCPDAVNTEEPLKRLSQFLVNRSSADTPPGALDLHDLFPDSGLSYAERIVEAGIRALSDWRATMTFLARTRVVARPPERLLLEEVDTSVTDAFNTFITRDKQPNLGHKIIAHLSGPLRVSTLLTTNFDTLTEDAYRTLSLPLKVLPVSAKGALPHARTTASSDTLIKLHGEAHDTRADLTLDDEPTGADKATFSAYMTRGTGHLLRKRTVIPGQRPHVSRPHVSNRLLVIGYSGSDFRCVQMMKHWLETAGDSPRIYWICFSSADLQRVRRLFSAAEFSGKVRITVSSRPDLLLFELFQRLVLSLPPGGLTYEFSHAVPPRRQRAFDHSTKSVAEALATLERVGMARNPRACDNTKLFRDALVMLVRTRILQAVRGTLPPFRQASDSELCRVQKWLPSYRTESMTSYKIMAGQPAPRFEPQVLDACGGVVRATALAVEELSKENRRVFWLEMQDYMDGDALLRDFLRSLALRFGQFHSRHVTMHLFGERLPDKWEACDPQCVPECPACDGQMHHGRKMSRLVSHLQMVLSDYRTDPSSVVVLIYGRDSYGTCSGLLPSTWGRRSQGFYQLHFFIEALGRAGIPTVYFPLTECRSRRKREAIRSLQVADESKGADDRDHRPRADSAFNKWVPDEFIPNEFIPKDAVHSSEEPTIDDLASESSVYQEIVASALSPFYEIEKDPQSGGLRFILNQAAYSANYKQLEFVYALTLFRHSRHPNAACSEGVFPCPFRFRAQSLDNDFVRAMEAKGWIDELHAARLFFTKPGGSVWMHRDARLGIQKVIETTSLHFNQTAQLPERRYFGLLEIRGRLHFWIGDWYQKAFLSSGHLAPVIEAIHHLVMCAIYSRYAIPKRTAPEEHDESLRADHRCMMFESALMQASKTLLLAWHWIEMWQASACLVSWLSEQHGDRLRKELLEVVEELVAGIDDGEPSNGPGKREPAKERLRRSVGDFHQILLSLGKAVLLEGGGGARSASGGLGPETVALRLRRNDDKGNPAARDDDYPTLAHGIEDIDKDDGPFREAIENAFSKCGDYSAELWQVVWKLGKAPTTSHEEFGMMKAKWKVANGDDGHKLHDVIWVLGETAYVVLRRAKLLFHAKGTIDSGSWLISNMCCNLGIDMCKHLPPWLLGYEAQAKVKMHSIYAIGLANLGRFFEANRHLDEAQSLLSKSPTQSPKDYAIIALRRAEVKLTECYWIALFLAVDPSADRGKDPAENIDLRDDSIVLPDREGGGRQRFVLPELAHGAVNCWKSQLLEGRMKSVRERHSLTDADVSVVPPNIFECFRSSRPPGLKPGDEDKLNLWRNHARDALRKLYASKLDEAVSLLEKAERNLGGSSQSSLWWSRLRTLNLRVYGLLTPLGDMAETSLVFRRKSSDVGIFDSFVSAVRIAGEDDFRRFRALKYFLEANQWYCQFVEGDEPDTNKGDFYSRCLPDSIKVARDVWKDLTHNCSSGNPGGKLLGEAIGRCRRAFRDVLQDDS